MLVIDSIPLVLKYIVPGYCCLFLFKTTCAKKYETSTLLAASCIISYLLLCAAEVFKTILLKKMEPNGETVDTILRILNNELTLVCFITLVGCAFTLIFSVIVMSKTFEKICIKLFHQDMRSDIWGSVLDFNKGSGMKVYLRDKDFYILGAFYTLEIQSEDPWLALSNFEKRDIETNEIYKEEKSYLNYDTIITTLRLSDVERVEIFNAKKPKSLWRRIWEFICRHIPFCKKKQQTNTEQSNGEE